MIPAAAAAADATATATTAAAAAPAAAAAAAAAHLKTTNSCWIKKPMVGQVQGEEADLN